MLGGHSRHARPSDRGGGGMRRGIWVALQVAVFALVAWAVWKRLAPELAGVRAADFTRWRPSAGYLVAATIGLTLLHLMQAYLWRRIVIDMGARPPDARTTIRVYFLAGLARFIPGSVWQFAGLAALGQQSGIPALASTAAGVFGNLAFLVTGVLFLALTLPGVPGIGALLLAVAAAGAAVVAVFVFSATSAGARLRAWGGRRAPQRLRPALEMAARIRPSHAAGWTLGYAASWTLLGASFALFTAAFVPGALLQWRQLAGVMAASYIAGYLVIVAPGGLGVREGVMVRLLAGLIPAPAAVLVALAHRLWFFVAEFLALGTFVLLPKRRPDASGIDSGGSGPGERKLMEVL